MLVQGSKELGIVLSDEQVSQFYQYYQELVTWNQKMNLTAITEEKEVIVKHFLDCLTPAVNFDFTTCKTLIDMGTGAGFPGIPLKIAYPHLKITLVDSLQKRIHFLQEVTKGLGLENVECVHGRAEELGQNSIYREQYDLCVSRAVSHLSVLYEYTLPFIKTGGVFLALKGPNVKEELEEGKKALQVLGGQWKQTWIISLPYSDITHSIIQIKKARHTPTQYPRKAGKPSKSPII